MQVGQVGIGSRDRALVVLPRPSANAAAPAAAKITRPTITRPAVAHQADRLVVSGARSSTKCVASAAVAARSPTLRDQRRTNSVMMAAPSSRSSTGVPGVNIPSTATGVKTTMAVSRPPSAAAAGCARRQSRRCRALPTDGFVQPPQDE